MSTRLFTVGVAIIGSASFAFCTVIMDQIGPSPIFTVGTTTSASQDFEQGLDRYDVASLDDFAVLNDRQITQVEAVVSMFNFVPSASLTQAIGWRVEIYSSPLAASTNLTGDVASQWVPTGSIAMNTNWELGNPRCALVTVPVNIQLSSAGTYWLAVVPLLSYSTAGQIGIRDSVFGGAPSNANSVQANPNGGFGFQDNWMARNTNSAYRITAVPEPSTLLLFGLGSIAVLRSKRLRTGL